MPTSFEREKPASIEKYFYIESFISFHWDLAIISMPTSFEGEKPASIEKKTPDNPNRSIDWATHKNISLRCQFTDIVGG